MEHDMPQDKRAIRRFALQLPVMVTAKSGEVLQATAESRDVSSHGICFYCNSALEADSAIEFTVMLPSEITMTEPLMVRCAGKVLRTERPQKGEAKFAVAATIHHYEFVADDEEPAPMVSEADVPPRV